MESNEPKKISFGFITKKSNILVKPQPLEEKKVEIIEYLEEKSIKVVGGDDKPKGPLVIPMKHPNKKLTNLVDIVKNDFKEPEPETNETTSKNGSAEKSEVLENLTLEEQAARELLNDSHNNAKAKEEVKRVIDASKNTDKITFEGEKESTIEDYDDIPIDEFGKAMLRGMGWKDGHGIGKNEQLVKMSQPLQRPKGMGLGADKLTKQDKNEKPAVDRDGNALKCVKKAYVKIIAGYHKGNYGQIIGLDDESGRFIIKTALSNINVSLNEFLVTPVTKEEYTKNSKVINNAKYEEYIKKKELEEQIKLNEATIKIESSDEDKKNDEDRRKQKDKKYIKKERKSSESDEEDNRSRRREKINKEIKKERKSSNSDYEEKYSKREKNEKRTVKKERRSSESDYEENRRSRKDKNQQSTSKYDSDDKYKKDESRDRRNRDKYKESKSKRYSDESDNEREEKRKSKKKSSKYNSDSDDYQQSSKKKHKKKKSKKHSSDDSTEEKYKRKSKKSDRKKYDDSDSEEEKYKKTQKKDKYREKRDRSRH